MVPNHENKDVPLSDRSKFIVWADLTFTAKDLCPAYKKSNNS